MKKPLAANRGGTAKPKGKPRGKPFPPNNNANPSGRPKVPDDLKAVLKANSIPLYERGLRLLTEAEESGNLSVASTLLLGLLRKSIPDATSLELTGKDGGPIQTSEVSHVRATLAARLAAHLSEGETGRGTGEPDGG